MPDSTRTRGALTLEQDLGNITALHNLRDRADQLRRDAIEQLYKVMTEQSKDTEHHWVRITDQEPGDLVHPAIVALAARREFVRGMDKIDLEAFLKEPLKRLEAATIDHFFKPDRHCNRVPIFQAARVLQACLTSPNEVFSTRSMIAYYRVVRELATVGPGNWIYGGTRATEGGLPSAFMTSECARAIAGMARALRQMGKLIEIVLTACEAEDYASSLALAPKPWKDMEIRRIALSAYADVAAAARRTAVDLKKEDYRELLEPLKDGTTPLRRFCSRFQQRVEHVAVQAASEIKKAQADIEKQYLKEKAETHGDPSRKHAGRDLGHATAFEALNYALKLAADSVNAAAEIKKFNADPGPNRKRPKELKDIVLSFRKRANEIGQLLETTQIYMESVIDKEIERASTGQMNAGELMFAAAAYAAQGRPETDRRVQRAADLLCHALLWDGSFAVSSVLDTDEHGYSAVVVVSEVHRAFAYLLEKSRFDVDPDVAERVVNFFDNSALRSGDDEIIGWAHDQPRHPRQASRWVTALSILALDRITRMLDKTINRKIFRHFTVTSPKELKSKPTLDKLFYPDYGLVNSAKEYAHEERPGDSVAYYLERMRAHVLAVGVPPEPDEQPPSYALLLFGPPGTGKTTLLEGLAASSKVHYVEVTPSDFLVEGDALIERRARDVFRCLSYLTRSVILFDEFDPMIRSREIDDSKSKLDRFAFLTPGMLPKLKSLNESAKKRNVAYCLITNRIGTLDSAAIRSGRFDHKIGVYPPDALSRAGRLAYVAEKLTRDDKTGKYSMGTLDGPSFLKTIEVTKGGGMTLLGKPGNFSPPKKPGVLPKSSALDSVFFKSEFKPGAPDADPTIPRTGAGDLLKLEDLQWSWVITRDQKVKAQLNDLLKTIAVGPGELERALKEAPTVGELAEMTKRVTDWQGKRASK